MTDTREATSLKRRQIVMGLAASWLPGAFCANAQAQSMQPLRLQSWPLNTPNRTGIHDLAPAPDGGVWYSAQRSGHLG